MVNVEDKMFRVRAVSWHNSILLNIATKAYYIYDIVFCVRMVFHDLTFFSFMFWVFAFVFCVSSFDLWVLLFKKGAITDIKASEMKQKKVLLFSIGKVIGHRLPVHWSSKHGSHKLQTENFLTQNKMSHIGFRRLVTSCSDFFLKQSDHKTRGPRATIRSPE